MQSSLFISYHHNDKIIGEAIQQQVTFLASKGKGTTFLRSFLDVRDIKPGRPWQGAIDDALKAADWLVAVCTGEQSVYCGYEIGTFKQIHAEDLKDNTAKKYVMGLYDMDFEIVPVVLKTEQNTFVPSVDSVVNTEDVSVLASELDFWYGSRLGDFLQEFCNYKHLYTPQDEQKNPSAYKSNIAHAAKSIANAFALAKATDIKEETQCQIGFTIDIVGASAKRITAIPEEAVVIGTSLAFNVIGIQLPFNEKQAPRLAWGQLKKILGTGRGDVPWMHKIEADIVLAAENRSMSSDDVTFRAVTGRILRPILSRHVTFMNGDRRFYIMLVETLDRRFAGSPHTSLLLTAIILGSRWRFTYFERWAETVSRTFGDDVPLSDFADSCRQLFYNIEWIEKESAEFGANDVNALIDAFGPEHRARVERFFTDWDQAKKRLSAAYPGLGCELTTSNREDIRKAILAFLESTRLQNDDFLQLAVKKYSEALKSELGKENGFPAHAAEKR